MLVNSKRWKLAKYCLIELVCIFSFDSKSERSNWGWGRGWKRMVEAFKGEVIVFRQANEDEGE